MDYAFGIKAFEEALAARCHMPTAFVDATRPRPGARQHRTRNYKVRLVDNETW
jgi:hypothetical protein